MIRFKVEWIETLEDGGHSHEAADWWMKFMFDPENIHKDYNEALKPWNGRTFRGDDDGWTTYVDFETEEDATLFILRWG